MTRLRIWMANHHQPPPTHFDNLSGVEKARAIARQAMADRLEHGRENRAQRKVRGRTYY